MASDLTIVELVRNGTLCADAAALLWAMVEEQHSFIVVAMPRLAGKTTIKLAALGLLPQGVPVHYLNGDEAEMDRLKDAAAGGYLVVGEFSQAPVPTYIWGPPVRRVFDTMRAGYALTTSLHAPGLTEAFEVICQGNEVLDEDASRIHYVLYLRRLGQGEETYWRRLAELHEVDQVVDGRPRGRLLHRWREEDDSFEMVEAPRLLRASETDLRQRARKMAELAASGRTSQRDVASLLSAP